MTRPNTNLAIRFLPSLTDVAFLLPIAFIFARLGGAKLLLEDGDTGWHVRTGEWILANGRVPHQDLFSFSRAGEAWFAWEWLWDVVFARLHQFGGMAAVVLASLLVICVTSALVYRLALRKCENIIIAFGVTVVAIAGSTVHWLARPHLFTLLFAVIFYHILERVQDGNSRLLVLLPLLTVLWTNLHAGWIAGILIILPYAAGEFTSWLVESAPDVRRTALLRGRRYLLCAAGCVAATFINPYFYQLHLHILRYLREPYQFDHVAEFQTLSFHHPTALFLECMLLWAAFAVFWGVSRRRFVYAFLLLGWAHLALFTGRNIPIFLVLAAPQAAAAIQDLLAKVQSAEVSGWLRKCAASLGSSLAGYGEMDRISRFHVTSALVFTLIAAVFYAPAPPESFRAEYDRGRYPAKAVEALRGTEFSKQIFADDEWGDYLIYRLYPASKVFIDGRSDFYGQSFEQRYLDLMEIKHGWESTLNRYHVETVVLSVNAPLASTLKESRNWRVVYDDGVAIIFRPAGANTEQEAKQLSANGSISGIYHDCHIAKTGNRDLRITQHNP